MKHRIVKSRLVTMLIAILSCFVMLFGAVFSSLPSFEKDSSITFADDTGGGETKPDHTYELQSITVAPAEDWAFTDKTPTDMIYQMVTITVVYKNVTLNADETVVLELKPTGSANVYSTATGETVKFDNIQVKQSTYDFQVTIELRTGADAGEVETVKSCSFNFSPESRTQNGIAATYDESIGKDELRINSGTRLTGALWDAFTVYSTYNDGTREADSRKTQDYAFSGDFFPAVFEKRFVNAQENTEFYDKEITISKTGTDYTTTVNCTNVAFKAPIELGSKYIQGDLPTQQFARSELDISGLTVSLGYAGYAISVPLSAFKNYFTPTYYTHNFDDSQTAATLTRAVKRVRISFYYPGETSSAWNISGSYEGITVSPLGLHVPSLPNYTETPLIYNEGAFIHAGNWDYNAQYQNTEEYPSPKITITAANQDVASDKSEDLIQVTGLSDTEDPKDGNVKIEFLKAGMTCVLTFELDDSGDFDWQNPPNNYVTKPDNNNFKLQLIVQVSKGTLEITLSEIDASMEYGTQNGDGSLSAKILNTNPEVTLSGKWAGGLESKIPTEWPVNGIGVWKYHLEYYTSQSAAEAAQKAYNEEAVKDAPTLPSPAGRATLPTKAASGLKLDRPKDAGTYYVIAVAHENGGYFAAASNVVSFTITPYEIKTGIKNREFDRQNHSLNDFLTANDDDGNPLNNFKYGDKAENILDITGDSTYGTANNYTVKVTVKTTDNYSNNYTLQEGSGTPSSKTLEFSITTSKESDFEFEATGWTFNEADAEPKITIKKRSDTYYPSYTTFGKASPTLAELEKDFDIAYYTYTDGKKGNDPITTATYATFQQWPAGDYIAVLTAKAETRSQDYLNRAVLSNENPQKAEGIDVSYLLPEHEWKFTVAASAIKVPYLEEATKWAFLEDIKSASIGNELGTYKASEYKYEFKNWIENNTAANGNTIITVTIKYYLWTDGSESNDYATVSGKDISIKNAGKYVILIELNPNYKWDTTDLPEKMVSLKPTTREYKFAGYISRQQIDVLTDASIKNATGQDNVFSGLEQIKTIDGMKDNAALQITSVSVGSLGNGHTPISGGIAWFGGTETLTDVTLTRGQFAVLNAGKYTVAVDIADKANYMWNLSSDSEGRLTGNSKEVAQLELYYTLDQAILQVQWADDSASYNGTYVTTNPHPKFGFNGTNNSQQKTPTATPNLQGDFAKDNKKIEIRGYEFWAYYSGASNPFGESIRQEQVNAKGYYYISVSIFADKDSANPAAANYKATHSELAATIFEITAYQLNKPTFDEKIEETYKGTAYDLTSYIENFDTDPDYNIGGTPRIAVNIVVGGSEAKNKGVYTVRITLTDKENFAWADGEEYYEFTLTIKALPVVIQWVTTTVTFSPAATAGGDFTTANATCTIENIAPAGADEANKDVVSIVLGYKKDGQDVTLSKMNAGKYTVYAAGLTGADSANYTLEGATNIDSLFTIKKLGVDRFEVADTEKVVNNFNGISGTLLTTALTNFVNADVQIAVSGRVPGGTKGWFTNKETGDITLEGLPTLEFKNGADRFEYTRAGIYSFTVSLNPTNYYWKESLTDDAIDFDNENCQGGRYVYTLEDAFTVNPRLLTAPAMGTFEPDSEKGGEKFVSQRAQEFNKEPASALEIIFSRSLHDEALGSAYDVAYNVQFGDAKNGGALQDDWLGWLDENDHSKGGKQGFYFALLTLNVSANPLNYQWVYNTSDDNRYGEAGDGYLRGYSDVFVYADGTVTAKLHYTITSSIVRLTAHVNNYYFGDNGQVVIASGSTNTTTNPIVSFNPEGNITGDGTVWLEGDDLYILQSAPAVLKDGWEIIEGWVDDGAAKVDDLENGLPWKVGKYALKGYIQFGDGYDYQDMPVFATFEVKARTITFEWDETALTENTYNHKPLIVTPKITTQIYRLKPNSTEYDTDNNWAGGLTLNVVWEDHETDKPVNAGSYPLIVNAIEGTNSDCFVLPEAENCRATLTINKKDVTIEGKSLLDDDKKHVYGDSARLTGDSAEVTFAFVDDEDGEIANLFAEDGAINHLFVGIFHADRVTAYKWDDNVGIYYIIVRWENSNEQYAQNYNVTFTTNVEFEVVKRIVTIDQLTESETYGVKGNAIDLYSMIHAVTTNGRDADAPFAGFTAKDIILLSPEYAETDTYPDVRIYKVTPSLRDGKDANWTIKFTEEDNWTFEITNATITAKFKTNGGQTYQAKNLTVVENTENNILLPEATANNAVWQYRYYKEGEDISKATEWANMTVTSEGVHTVEVKDAGTYYIFIKIAAKNYNTFELQQAIVVEVYKAKLTVKFDLEIMYGEADPTSEEIRYQFGTAALRTTGSSWTVKDLLGEDQTKFYESGAFYGLTGDVTYSIADFPTWDWNHSTPLDTYTRTITINNAGELTCTNYTFEAEDGKLTVKQIIIKVTGKTVNVVYNTDFKDFPHYTEEDLAAVSTDNGYGYTVEHPTSTYDAGTKYKTAQDQYKGLITVTSDAFKATASNPTAKPTTADVKEGGYELKIEGASSSTIYYVQRVDDGTVNITKAELPAYDIKGYDKAFDQQYHGLFVGETSTVNTNGSWNKAAFKETSDGNEVKTEFWEVDRVYSTINDTILEGLSDYKITDKEGPIYIDAGLHYIIYRISAGKNYTPIYGQATINITQATNELKDNTDFKFNGSNAPVYPGKNFQDAAEAAWTYGYGVDGGFDVNDRHIITEPVARYNRASATNTLKLKYWLYYSEKGEGDGTLLSTVAGEYDNVTALFEELFKDSNNFKAGYYRLEVFMAESTNFTSINVNYVFRVEKRVLHVKVSDTSTIYGEDAPAFTPAHTGLVPNSSTSTEAESIETALNADTPKFTTEYTKGAYVKGGQEDPEGKGKYYIRVESDDRIKYDEDLGYYLAENYCVYYDDAWLTVNERPVQITIQNKTSTYNKKETLQDLTFKLTVVKSDSASERTYDLYGDPLPEGVTSKVYHNTDQTLLTLFTKAIINVAKPGEDPDWNTNHVITIEKDGQEVPGGYTIYAVFKGDSAINYVVKFDDCDAAEDGSGVTESGQEPIGVKNADTTNNAGLYTILKAYVELDIKGVYHINDAGEEEFSSYYSGAENFYRAFLRDPDHTPIEFTYYRSEDGTQFGKYVPMGDDEYPVDVGWYQVEGTTNSQDYYNGSLGTSFEILPAQVDIKATAATVRYGTYLSGNWTDDNQEGGAQKTGLFTGFEYTVSSRHDILEEQIKAYRNIANGLVTYATPGYTPSTGAGTSGIEITPVCKSTKNITFIPNAAALTILKRQITLTVVGWDEANSGDPSKHNALASSPYTGNQKDLQAALTAAFEKNRSSFIYADPTQNTFGASGDSFDVFNVELKLDGNAKNAGMYEMTYSCSYDNYEVTWMDKEEHRTLLFAVLKVKLTLYANFIQEPGVAQSYAHVIYGESISTYVQEGYETAFDYDGNHYDKTLRFAVSGMVNEEVLTSYLSAGDVKFTITLKDDPAKTAYTPWESTVTQTYLVEIVEVTRVFTNYEIVTYIPAELTISQRPINAKVTNTGRIFSFGETITEGGASGMNHVATIEFTDGLKANETNNANVNTNYRPEFSLKYKFQTEAAKNYVTDAPTTVGKYHVQITLGANSNYKFEDGNSCVKEYEIIPMTVSAANLNWQTSPISFTEEDPVESFFNTIAKYQKEYLVIDYFMFLPTSGASMYLTEGQKGDGYGYYYFDNNGHLCIDLDTSKQIYGRYTVVIKLQDSAKINLTLLNGTEEVDFVPATFVVTTDKVTMQVWFEDFEYGSVPDIENMLTVIINEKQTDNVTLRYAEIDDKDITKVKGLYTQSKNGGLSGTDISGLSFGTLTISPTFKAGYYLLSVYSAEFATTQYYVFQVTPKAINAPTVVTEKQTLSSYYNGNYQSIEVTYSVNDMTPSFSGNMLTANGTVTFTVLDAATYSIQFVLYDKDNTKWNSILPEGAKLEEDGITITYTWTILQDTTQNDGDVVTVTKELDNMIYGDDYKGEIWTKGGYKGEMKLYYTPKLGDEEAPSEGCEWKPYFNSDTSQYVRLDVGSYWIKVVLLETSNYGEKVAIGQFTISPKKIQATISGSITYGESIYDADGKSTKFRPSVTGILSGDPAATIGEYEYVLVNAYGDFKTQAGHLIAGEEYYIILVTEGQGVKGITVGDKGNYVIEAVQGRLVVNKRSVMVTISGASSDYSIDPQYALNNVEYDIDSDTPLAPGETKEVLGLVFYTDATVNSAAGGVYWITITDWEKTNYNISYQRASFTINPLEVEITLDPQTDIFYGDKVVGATFDAEDLKVSNPLADKNQIIENLRDALRLHYTGTSYAGVYYDSDRNQGKAPVAAGVYTAQVTGAGDNYILIGSPSVEFTIQKQYVDSTKLEIASQTYTGASLTPRLGVVESEFEGILSLVTATIVSYTNAATYQIVVTLNDANNYQWDSTQDATVTVPFIIQKASDEIVGEFTIKDWQYGCYSVGENTPSAQVKSGSAIIFEYSTDGKNFSNIVPDTGDVGEYYVRILVAESENYLGFISEPMVFHITKYYLAVPEIIESDDTFTGNELLALISNYDARYMTVMDESEARTYVGAANITAVAVNAGTYRIFIAINNFKNCGWLGDKGDNDGVLTLLWTVNKMKVELPTAGKNNFVVNGSQIVYIPDGFDESIMSIENNVQSYGGDFVAVVTLKDTSNYEWANGSLRVELKWHITGANTLLAIILAVLATCAVAGAAGIITQIMLDKKRKRTEAEALAAIENKDIAEGEEGDGAQTPEAGNAEAESKPENKPEESSEPKAEEPSKQTADKGGNE